MYGEYEQSDVGCTNCGNKDATLFQYISDNDSCTCTNCGAVLDNLGWAEYVSMAPGPIQDIAMGLVELATEVGDQQTKNARKKAWKGTYNRKAYAVERIRAAVCEEPKIVNEDHIQAIKDEYALYANQNMFQQLRATQGYIKKRDIQAILRSIDRKRGKTRFSKKKGIEVPYNEFCTKYLEKWKSIKILLGGDVKKYTPEEAIRIGTWIVQHSQKWNYAQPPSRKETREDYKFPERTDFPAINFMIRRGHRRLGIRGMDTSFPLPVTRKANERLHHYAEFLDPTLPKFKQLTLEKFAKK
jgi:hypothetical protein